MNCFRTNIQTPLHRTMQTLEITCLCQKCACSCACASCKNVTSHRANHSSRVRSNRHETFVFYSICTFISSVLVNNVGHRLGERATLSHSALAIREGFLKRSHASSERWEFRALTSVLGLLPRYGQFSFFLFFFPSRQARGAPQL